MQQILKYKLLQAPIETEYVFRDYNEALKLGFNLNDYKVVHSDTISVGTGSDTGAVAELLFMIFNSDKRPENYKGRSMSVSDVVIIDNDIYYCDDFGFKKLYE